MCMYVLVVRMMCMTLYNSVVVQSEWYIECSMQRCIFMHPTVSSFEPILVVRLVFVDHGTQLNFVHYYCLPFVLTLDL